MCTKARVADRVSRLSSMWLYCMITEIKQVQFELKMSSARDMSIEKCGEMPQ